MSAAICSGLRWTLVQFKLQTLDPPLGGPVVTMRVLSSTMFISMLLLSFIIERPWTKLGPEHGDYFSTVENGMRTISLGLTGAFIAIAMVLCEFWLIIKSTAVVLMIGGVLKEIITIFVGVTLFGDHLNVVNISGLCVVFLGVFLYKMTLHISNMEKEAAEQGDNTQFSRINSLDVYEDESSLRRGKRRKDSDPDVALTFTIEDEDIDEEVIMVMEGSSPLRERINGPLELDTKNASNQII
ncbi:hypothetical protein ACHAWF_012332 [Thalassiosira exigua]